VNAGEVGDLGAGEAGGGELGEVPAERAGGDAGGGVGTLGDA
jgi:hypothetical protein